MTNAGGPRSPSPPPEPRKPDPLPWIGLSVAAFVLLSFPWVSPFAEGRHLLGIPLILWYLFGVWGALILIGALARPEA